MLKILFLNGFIKEKVYVKHLPSFENTKMGNHVLKLNKALNNLKQASQG